MGYQHSILVVDDELGIRDLCQFTLEPLGFEVVTARNGLEALEHIRSRPFDLVILDVHMPKMGGPETLLRLRALRPEQRVIVVSSGSDATQAFETKVAAEGIVECLFKPLELDELTGAIERALARTGGRCRGSSGLGIEGGSE